MRFGYFYSAYTARYLMELDVKQDCAGVDWKSVSETLKCVGMAYDEPDVHRKA